MKKQNFLKPDQTLLEAGLAPGMIVTDLGCGNGFFTIPAAKIIGDKGLVWAVDILDESLGFLASTARVEKLRNIRTHRCDLEDPSQCDIPPLSVDFIIVGKVVSQIRHPENLLKICYKVLKTGGVILVIEWCKDNRALGPDFSSRIGEENAVEFFSKQGFKYIRQFNPDYYHYCLVFQK